MIITPPSDIIFEIGSFKIYYYGVIMALSVIMGLLICKFVCKKFYESKDFDIIYGLSIGTILCGFLGARIYYVFAAYKYFSNNLWEIFAFRHGGMSIHGAIIGGLIFVIFYLKYNKLPVLKYLDILSFGLVSGQITGRWGNFFNSEAFGLPAFSFVKLYVPIEKRPIGFEMFEYFHPTFLYESLLNLLVLSILFFVAKKTKDIKYGYVFFTYILLYSIVRLFTEYLRTDSVLNFYNIPLAQVVSVIGICIGIIGISILQGFKISKKN